MSGDARFHACIPAVHRDQVAAMTMTMTTKGTTMTTKGTTMTGETMSDLERRARLELHLRYRAYLRAASSAWTWRDHPDYGRADRAEARLQRQAAEGLVWVITGRYSEWVERAAA